MISYSLAVPRTIQGPSRHFSETVSIDHVKRHVGQELERRYGRYVMAKYMRVFDQND